MGETTAVTGGDGSGAFTDERDGQTYRTVKIGNQVWMAENLRYKIDGSWCYDNCDFYCQKYGRLYDWNAAMIACPKGWHLSSNGEWSELVKLVGYSMSGITLRATSGWPDDDVDNIEGTDDFGFSALPGGGQGPGGELLTAGYAGHWWTATEYDSECAYCRHMGHLAKSIHQYRENKNVAFSVRCVAD